MIPKKIHFTWFSTDLYPGIVTECMLSWKKYLPDYEIVHWDLEKISRIDNQFLHEALSVKKWAFAADFIRLYALYNEGGIYLDTDVEVYKNYDELLADRAFIGKDSTYHVRRKRAYRYLTSHCMGAEPLHPFIKACLEYYKDRPFILSNEDWLPDSLRYDEKILPFIQTEIAKMFGYHPSERIKGVQTLNEGVKVYPGDYFDARRQTKQSYCRHIGLEGWRSKDPLFKKDSSNKLSQGFAEYFGKLLELGGYASFKKL